MTIAHLTIRHIPSPSETGAWGNNGQAHRRFLFFFQRAIQTTVWGRPATARLGPLRLFGISYTLSLLAPQLSLSLQALVDISLHGRPRTRQVSSCLGELGSGRAAGTRIRGSALRTGRRRDSGSGPGDEVLGCLFTNGISPLGVDGLQRGSSAFWILLAGLSGPHATTYGLDVCRLPGVASVPELDSPCLGCCCCCCFCFGIPSPWLLVDEERREQNARRRSNKEVTVGEG